MSCSDNSTSTGVRITVETSESVLSVLANRDNPAEKVAEAVQHIAEHTACGPENTVELMAEVVSLTGTVAPPGCDAEWKALQASAQKICEKSAAAHSHS